MISNTRFEQGQLKPIEHSEINPLGYCASVTHRLESPFKLSPLLKNPLYVAMGPLRTFVAAGRGRVLVAVALDGALREREAAAVSRHVSFCRDRFQLRSNLVWSLIKTGSFCFQFQQ
jgi:hypothetical protein